MKNKYTMNRDFWLPKNLVLTHSKEGVYDIYVRENTMEEQGYTGFSVCSFSGKKAKYDSYFRYKTAEEAKVAIDKFIANIERHQASIVARRVAKSVALKAPVAPEKMLKVGDILEHTGGYNSTNTRFVKIKSFNKTGKKAIVFELGKHQVDGDWMNGNIAPTDSDGVGREELEFRVTLGYNSSQVLRGGLHGWTETWYKWDGKPIWNNCD